MIPRSLPLLILAAGIAGSAAVAWAQEALIVGEINDGTPLTPAVSPEAGETEARLGPRQVEVSVAHDLGDHTVLLQRVTPPEIIGPEPTPEQLARTEARRAQAFETWITLDQRRFLSLGATVFNHQLTYLQWRVGGESFSAWSNVDFALIAGAFSGFKDAQGNRYHLFLNWSEVEGPGRLGEDRWLGVPPEFRGTGPQYLWTEGDATIPGAGQIFEGLDALHQLVATHQAELQQAYAGREAREDRRRAEAEALAANPPPPEDVVVQFWPGEGSRYASAAAPKQEPTGAEATAATGPEAGQTKEGGR